VLAYRIGNMAHVVWEPPAGGPAASSYVVNVTGSFAGSLPTGARSVSGIVSSGAYAMSVAAVNPCGASPSSPPQTIVVP
jgi:hypothetical protein